ncbi:hypothetical protein [Paraburkholderia sp. J63]|uniref:hypothetical protein n=1 Tax=Paraburkholderia sp. J63 TaxID=2805434 RepID=UPI002ABD2CEB|nr:hypothetical protein [Paraburkholderia sp. J63]
MKDIPQSVPVQPESPLSMGTRAVQLGFDQFEAALGLHAKRLEHDRAAAKHACDAFMQMRPYDMTTFAQTWQTLMREYLAANVALWEQSLGAAAQNQAAYGALLRDTVLNMEKAWMRGVPASMTGTAGAVPQAGDWFTYLGRFASALPNGMNGATGSNGEVRAVQPEHRGASAGA